MALFSSFAWRALTVLALVGLLGGGLKPAQAAAAIKLPVELPIELAVRSEPAVQLAGLTPEDHTLLYQHLQVLAVENSSPSSDIVIHILSKPQYEYDDWVDFFTFYFDLQHFTYRLYENLTGAVFWQIADDRQGPLQLAITHVMMGKIQSITSSYGGDLGPALAQNEGTRATMGSALRWMMYTALHGNISPVQRQELFDFSIDYIEQWPQYWRKTAIDTTRQPVIAALAAQLHANLREFVGAQVGNKARVTAALALEGRYLALWNSFSLLIYDNNGLDAAQRDFIYNYYNALPRGLRHTRGISVADFLANQPPHRVELHLPGVNIFGLRIGAIPENGFPPDVAPLNCDVFTIVVAHETNHSTNAIYIGGDPLLQLYHEQLISNAGRERLNYLRSSSEEGFFVDNRQEFFAAIANQWFCSSDHTFRVGMERWRQGRPHPLDQALYFANIYSLKTGTTYFYNTDMQGKITRRAVPIYHDGWGQATGILLQDGPIYVYRKNGIIQKILDEPPVVEASPAAGLSATLPPESQVEQTLQLRNNGRLDAAVWLQLAPMAPGTGSATFSRQSALRVENSPSLNVDQQLTIEAWVNPTTWEDGHLNNGRILQKGEYDNQYRLTVENGDFLFDLAGVGSVRIAGWKPPLNTWTHVAATYDGAKLRIIVDGAQMVEQAASGKLNTSSDSLYIGNKNAEMLDSFIGQMDEVRVWSLARTAEQINQYRYHALDPHTQGLVGFWKFDMQPPEEARVLDRSGYNNHAQPVGGVQMEYQNDVNWAWINGDYWEEPLSYGETIQRQIRFSSTGVLPGVYKTTLTVTSNDPQNPLMTIPVQLTVTDPQPVEIDHSLYIPLISR